MAQWHSVSKRKPSGGIRQKARKKRKYERGRDYIPVKIDEPKLKKIRVRGGNYKIRLLSTNYVIVNGEKLKILGVEHNPANRQFARFGIITKGAILKTEKGLVRVTSRPGQYGIVQGVFVKKE